MRQQVPDGLGGATLVVDDDGVDGREGRQPVEGDHHQARRDVGESHDRSRSVGIMISPSMRRETMPWTSSRSRRGSSSVLAAITTTPRSRARSSTTRRVSPQ